MPTYEYECPICGHDFEEFQSITAEPVADCPECGAAARRLISAGAGLIFKGAGFYITDYKNNGGQAQSANDEKKESSAETTSNESTKTATESKSTETASTKSDAKPAAAKSNAGGETKK